MRKFLTKFIGFMIISFFVIIVPNFFFHPYYGNVDYSNKLHCFNANKDIYNSVIFGSSRSYRQINPEILDKKLSDFELSTFNMGARTYNLGTLSCFNPEVYYLYEKFLKDIDSNEVKFAFVELQPINNIANKNIKTIRNSYWINVDYLSFAIAYIMNNNTLGIMDKFSLISPYIKSYVYKLTNFSKYKTIGENTSSVKCTGKYENGFYSLDQNMEDLEGNNEYLERFLAFREDTTELQERIKISNKTYSNTKSDRLLNIIHLRKLNKLIRKSSEKGIHLFLVIPPKMPDYSEIRELKKHIPNENIIDISRAEEFPRLYLSKNSFDIGHLNENGAKIYTELLAKEIFNICISENINGY